MTALRLPAGEQVRIALTRAEAARALGVSVSHFQRHVQGQVRCVYSGQLRLYPVRELEAWVERESCDRGRARR